MTKPLEKEPQHGVELPDKRCRPVSSSSVAKVWAAALKSAGLQAGQPTGFRYTLTQW